MLSTPSLGITGVTSPLYYKGDMMRRSSFNSLSRDHWAIYEKIMSDRSLLSTPSLGITSMMMMREDPSGSSLSTPSLGITDLDQLQLALRSRNGIDHFQLPLSGSLW